MWNCCYNFHQNHLWKLIYMCITWSVKAINIRIIDLNFNWFIGNNPEHNTTNHMFSPNLMCNRKMTHRDHPLLFIPHKPITHWLNFEVMEMMTKNALSVQSRYIILYNLSSTSLWNCTQNTRPYTPRNWY